MRKVFEKIRKSMENKRKSKSNLKKMFRKRILLDIVQLSMLNYKMKKSIFLLKKTFQLLSVFKDLKIRLLIRKWRLFNKVKKVTFFKYSNLSNSIYKQFNEELNRRENKKRIVNNGSITYISDNSLGNHREVFNNILNENENIECNKGKDYLSLSLIKKIEDILDKDTSSDINKNEKDLFLKTFECNSSDYYNK